MYDLILRNGTLYDVSRGLRGEVADIAIENGVIRKIAPDIPENAPHEIEVSGRTVTPGLIDFHAHFYAGGTGIALKFSTYWPAGVTSAVDAGSAGFGNIESFLSSQTEEERRNTKAYLYLGSGGLSTLPAHNENIHPKYFDRKKIKMLCERYTDRICGLKLRISAPIAEISGTTSLDSLRIGVEIAEECGLPISVHIPDFQGNLSQLIDILRPGDIFCLVFTPKRGILEDDRISPEIVRGRKKGVVMESACGKGHLGNRVAAMAIQEGFYPDIISGDFTKANYTFSPAGTLPYLMSRFMALGMTFEQVLACCTSFPAKKMGMEGKLGCIREGTPANLAVFQREQGEFIFSDVEGDTILGHEMLIPQATILEGEVVYNQTLCRSRPTNDSSL